MKRHAAMKLLIQTQRYLFGTQFYAIVKQSVLTLNYCSRHFPPCRSRCSPSHITQSLQGCADGRGHGQHRCCHCTRTAAAGRCAASTSLCIPIPTHSATHLRAAGAAGTLQLRGRRCADAAPSPGRRSAAGPAGDTAEVLALPARQENEEGRICPQRIGPRGLTVRRPPGVAASFTATTTGLPAGRGAAGTQGLNPASAITFPSLNRLREERAKERGSALPALPTKINSPSVSPRLRLMACDRAS